MPLAVSYAPLRYLVAHLLLADNLHGILYSFDRLVVPLNTLRASVSSDNVASINHDMLVSAFKSDDNEYILPYSHLGISDDGGKEHYLLVRCAMRFGKSKMVYKFGRFTNDGSSAGNVSTVDNVVVSFNGSYDDMKKHPMDQHSTKKYRMELYQKVSKMSCPHF